MKEIVKTVAVILFILICTCLVNGTQVKAVEIRRLASEGGTKCI